MNIAGSALFVLLCATSVVSSAHETVPSETLAAVQPSKDSPRRLRSQSSRDLAAKKKRRKPGPLGKKNFVNKIASQGTAEAKNDLAEIKNMLDRVFEAETMSVPTVQPTKGPTVPSPTIAPAPSVPVPTRPITPAPTFVPTRPITPAPTFECGVSPELRAEQIVLKMSMVSNKVDFVNPESPQSKALEWIITQDELYLCPDDPKIVQRYVMAVFYYSTDGDDWIRCSAPDGTSEDAIEDANEECDLEIDVGGGGTDAWLTPVSECNWGGLKCDPENDCVDRIDFEKNNLQGTIPFELQELKDLRVLHMEEGETAGRIPSELGTLSLLAELDLNFNLLTGTIPDELYNLGKMEELDLNDNLLEGIISSDIQKLELLRFFQISKNKITGTIPTSMGTLTQLAVVNFDRNQLTGSMPQEVCDLRNTAGGVIGSLTCDCLNPESQFYVACETPECCTLCFEAT